MFDTDYEGIAKRFYMLPDDVYEVIEAETKAELEPLGLWDEDKFGHYLYSVTI